MKEDVLAALSIDELKKKKKLAVFVLGVLVGLLIVNAIFAIIGRNAALVATSAALFTVSLPLMLGLKKINQELSKRSDR